MDVEHGLPGLAVRVEDRSVPALVIAVLRRQGGRPAKHRTHETIVAWRQVVQRGDVLPWHDQHVQRRLRIDVLEGHQRVVLVDDGARDFTRDDLAEEAVRVVLHGGGRKGGQQAVERSRIVGDVDNREDGHAAYAAITFQDDEATVTYYSRRGHWARDSELSLKIYEIEEFYR